MHNRHMDGALPGRNCRSPSRVLPAGGVDGPREAMADRHQEPVISVVVATLNAAATLTRCLASVLEQRYDAVELVVMDGGSTDGTRSILQQHDDRIAYWESAPDRGLYHAWNKALPRTTGQWICFLGADDRLAAPEVLRRVSSALLADEGRHLVAYGSVLVVDADGRRLRRVGRPWAEVRKQFLGEGMTIPHQGTFHHRGLFERHGPFDERFRIAGDYELLLRELVHGEPLYIPGLIVTEMTTGGLSDRPDMALRVATEIHRARQLHGLTRLPAALSLPIIRMRTRAWLTRRFGRRVADVVVAIYRATLGRLLGSGSSRAGDP